MQGHRLRRLLAIVFAALAVAILGWMASRGGASPALPVGNGAPSAPGAGDAPGPVTSLQAPTVDSTSNHARRVEAGPVATSEPSNLRVRVVSQGLPVVGAPLTIMGKKVFSGETGDDGCMDLLVQPGVQDVAVRQTVRSLGLVPVYPEEGRSSAQVEVPGEGVVEVELEVYPGASITATFTDPEGNPLQLVRGIQLHEWREEWLSPRKGRWKTEARCSWSGLDAGWYAVTHEDEEVMDQILVELQPAEARHVQGVVREKRLVEIDKRVVARTGGESLPLEVSQVTQRRAHEGRQFEAKRWGTPNAYLTPGEYDVRFSTSSFGSNYLLEERTWSRELVLTRNGPAAFEYELLLEDLGPLAIVHGSISGHEDLRHGSRFRITFRADGEEVTRPLYWKKGGTFELFVDLGWIEVGEITVSQRWGSQQVAYLGALLLREGEQRLDLHALTR